MPAVQGFIKDGRLKALAVGSDTRFTLLPDVPTMAEAGGGADTLIPTFFAFAAPAGTPPAIVNRLNAEMRKAIADPAIAEKFTTAGLVPNGSTPEQMTAIVKSDVPRFDALVKAIGIKPE